MEKQLEREREEGGEGTDRQTDRQTETEKGWTYWWWANARALEETDFCLTELDKSWDVKDRCRGGVWGGGGGGPGGGDSVAVLVAGTIKTPIIVGGLSEDWLDNQRGGGRYERERK